MTSTQAPSSQVVEGRIPVHPDSRTWGQFALFGSTTSAAVATWCFIGGGAAAFYLPAAAGALTLTAATLIGVFFVVLAAVPASTRYGIEAVRSTRPTLGIRGSNITLGIVQAIMVGWNSVLIVFMGNAAAEAAAAMGLITPSSKSLTSIGISIVGLIVIILMLGKGPDSVRDLGPVIALGILAFSVVIAIILIINVGPQKLFTASAVSPYDVPLLNFTTVIELGIAGGLSWWPYIGTLTRYSRSSQAAIMPAVIGLGVMMGFVLAIGLFAALAVPESGGDPTLFLIKVGGSVFGVIALIFIVFANIGTVMVGIYVSALALKQVPTVDRKIGWRPTTIVVAIPVVLVVLFFSGVFLEYYQNFLAFVGVLLGPVCGIQIVDYYIIRRQELDIRSLYTDGDRRRYWYIGGFNPSGIGALIAGMLVYVLLLNPLTYEPHAGFGYLTASLPAIVTGGIVYLALMAVTGNIKRGDAASHGEG